MNRLLTLTVIILFSLQTSYAADMTFFSEMTKKFKPSQPVVNVNTLDDEMTLSKQAVIYYSTNDINNAFNTLLSIKDEEKSSQDYLLLGNLLQDKDKISDAVFMYKRAIMLDEKNYKAYYNLANIYFEEAKYNLAIENYKMCNKINNKFPYAYYNLGCAYVQLGMLPKAKNAFLRAVMLNNTEPDFHYNLALTYKKLGKEKIAKQYLEFYNKLTEYN